MIEAEKERAAVERNGWLCRIERLLSSDTFSTICFALLLITFDVSTWQAVLTVLLYVKHTTEPAAWLKAERAEHLKEGR